MTALKVIGAIILILWLISLIRVGGAAEYSEDGLTVRLRAGPLRFTLYPMKPKKEGEKKPPKKKKEKKKEKQPQAEDHGEKPGGTLSMVMEFIPMAAEAAGRLLHKIRIDELVLHLTWAASDPAAAAMGFGAGQAALGALWPLLENNFNIKDRDVGLAVDFQRKEPIVYVRAALSLTIGQGVAFAVIYGVKALSIFLRHRPKKTKKPAERTSSAKSVTDLESASVERKEGTPQ